MQEKIVQFAVTAPDQFPMVLTNKGNLYVYLHDWNQEKGTYWCWKKIELPKYDA